MNRRILGILVASLFARILYVFHSHQIWWDAAVYLSMSEYMVSLGSLGFWEPIRPLLWPFLLGYGHILGNPILWGYIWTTLFSLGIVYLTYKISKNLFSEKIGLLSAFLASFTWIFFFFNVRLYTEIPSLFFALVAVYYFIKNKNFESGIFAGLAFLTKFPQGLLLVVLVFLLLPAFKKISSLLLGFILITLPFFIFNTLAYGSPIEVLLFASNFVDNAGIWIFQQPWYFYLGQLTYHNVLFLFAIGGFVYAFRRKKYLIPILLFVFLLYFSAQLHKELRFAILFLPYVAILAALGYAKVIKSPWTLVIITLLMFGIHFELQPIDKNPYFTFFEGKDIDGEVLITYPLSGYYLNGKSTLMYYPWFNASQGAFWLDYIDKYNPEYVSIDFCEGGFICPPNEQECPEKQQEIIEYLEKNYYEEYKGGTTQCPYLVYSQHQ